MAKAKTATKSTKKKATTSKKTAASKSSSKKTTATKKSTAAKAAGKKTVKVDRRKDDRRKENVPVTIEQREKVNRRRQIDPTTCERDYSNAEVEFMQALDDYKRNNGRMFPTCSEILEVIRDLGYVQQNVPAISTAPMAPSPLADTSEDAGMMDLASDPFTSEV